jgi:hypothetical protein
MALLVAQVDFAFLMFSAGFYKLTGRVSAQSRNGARAMQSDVGLLVAVLHQAGAVSIVFWTMNQLAWSTEVVAALLMLVPVTRELGALLIIFSFIFIATQIRLGFLTEMVMVCSLIFMSPSGAVGGWLESVLGGAAAPAATPIGWLAPVLTIALWSYLILLPLADAGLYYNFYLRRALPVPLQTVLDRYNEFFRHHSLARLLGRPRELLHPDITCAR